MKLQKRKILVTAALPYANGPIHLGHLVEYVQADIWSRYQKLRGHECYYICASDAHGSPIMLKAEELGITPEKLVSQVASEQERDFRAFQIEFDNFHTTHSKENQSVVVEIFEKLKSKSYIEEKVVQQFFDPKKKMFLPDRFIVGFCPVCNAPDQYGDSCEKCGSTYDATELKKPLSKISRLTPQLRESNHLFFKLEEFEKTLEDWLQKNNIQKGVRNKLEEWFSVGLKNWDISRDAPYFGFEIPGYEDKFFYVWLDAPIGYLGSFKNFCDREGLDFVEFTKTSKQTEMYHFIGKDIMYFHTLFWPAVLAATDYNLPKSVFVHGFLTINGEKMSKSRGTFITARSYLEHQDPTHLRFYFAAKLSSAIEDIDLNFDDFKARVDSDLIGKFVNIGSRSAGFISKYFGGYLSNAIDEPKLVMRFQECSSIVAEYYEQREFSRVVRELMTLADLANQYIDKEKPWILAKNQNLEKLHKVSTTGLILFRIISIYIKPIIPELVSKIESFFNSDEFVWNDLNNVPLGNQVKDFEVLSRRVESDNLAKMMESNKMPIEPETKKDNIISIDDFLKIDLRVAEIIEAEEITDSDKLLKLKLNLGNENIQVLAGIKKSYPEIRKLVGKKVICVANLKPRKMRFGNSEGMILGASDEKGGDVILVTLDGNGTAGMSVR